MSDSRKTKKELIAELEALRAKMQASQAEDSTPDAGDDNGAGMTRRDVLAAAWVAPIILTVPLGASVVSSKAHAQSTSVPTIGPVPTQAPTSRPTLSPTVSTNVPTNAPTGARPPTAAPTTAPPTAFPTAFPTAAPEIVPVELSDFKVG